jgi:hypothetical protein
MENTEALLIGDVWIWHSTDNLCPSYGVVGNLVHETLSDGFRTPPTRPPLVTHCGPASKRALPSASDRPGGSVTGIAVLPGLLETKRAWN